MKKFTRFLSVLLCVVMVFSLMPWGAVSAAEHAAPGRKAPKYPSGMPNRDRTIQTYKNEHYFTTFEDLKELSYGYYSETAYAVYAGEDMLTISQNLQLPDNLELLVPGILVINSNVTFSASVIYADSVAVNGTLTTVYAEIYTFLDVNGTYYNYYELQLWDDGFHDSLENIVNMENAYSYMWCYPTTTEALKEVIHAADTNFDNGWFYLIRCDEGLTITEDVILPWNCDLYVTYADVTIAEGATVTFCGYAWVYHNLVVNGTLVLENGILDIYYDQGGRMSVSGSCISNGYIYVTGSMSDPFVATPGLSGFEAVYDYDYACWSLIPGEDIPGEDIPGENPNQLGAPTNLGWGYDYSLGQLMPGTISWQNGVPAGNEFNIQIYCDGSYYGEFTWYVSEEEMTDWISVHSFSESDPGTGEYYFTVTASDSSGIYSDSPAAMSEKWYYVQPEAALAPCTNLSMDQNGLYWDAPADDTNVCGYEFLVLYDPDSSENMGYYDYAAIYYPHSLDSFSLELSDAGYYCFYVRMLSDDINQVCNGEWAGLSEPFYYDGGSGGDTPGGDAPGTDVVLPFDAFEWDVLRIANQERLAQGLEPLTMYERIQAATDVRAVEVDQYFSHTRPDGSSCFTALDEAGVEYWSAGENIAAGYRNPAAVMDGWMNSSGHRANILSEDFSHMGVGFYNYSWVQLFTDGSRYTSIQVLTEDGNAVEPGTTIGDMNLVAVLNSATYGTCYLPVEDVYCSGYDPNQSGTQTVTISVLGVSTSFEITVGGGQMTGDYDSDGEVDDADVAYLLWYTLFPESYPIATSGDINGDGAVNDADVAYLLWHTLFPDSYPL